MTYMNSKQKTTTIIIAFIISVLFCFSNTKEITVHAKGIPKSQSVSVLLIGNSMVSRPNNNTVKYLRNLAKGAGRKMTLEYVAHGNEKLKNWANPKNTYGKKAYKKIASRKWDYIILQEHTDYAIAHGSTFLNASKKLAAYIHKTCPNAKIIYNCTWAYDKTKYYSGKRYTYSAQQNAMNKNYKKVASATGGKVCWTGNAFKAYRKIKGAKNLYLADKNHATSYGWFLNACCMYAAIFESSPKESTYSGGLNKTQVNRLKKIAWQENH